MIVSLLYNYFLRYNHVFFLKVLVCTFVLPVEPSQLHVCVGVCFYLWVCGYVLVGFHKRTIHMVRETHHFIYWQEQEFLESQGYISLHRGTFVLSFVLKLKSPPHCTDPKFPTFSSDPFFLMSFLRFTLPYSTQWLPHLFPFVRRKSLAYLFNDNDFLS